MIESMLQKCHGHVSSVRKQLDSATEERRALELASEDKETIKVVTERVKTWRAKLDIAIKERDATMVEYMELKASVNEKHGTHIGSTESVSDDATVKHDDLDGMKGETDIRRHRLPPGLIVFSAVPINGLDTESDPYTFLERLEVQLEGAGWPNRMFSRALPGQIKEINLMTKVRKICREFGNNWPVIREKFMECQETALQSANAILAVFDFKLKVNETIRAAGMRFERLLERAGGESHARHDRAADVFLLGIQRGNAKFGSELNTVVTQAGGRAMDTPWSIKRVIDTAVSLAEARNIVGMGARRDDNTNQEVNSIEGSKDVSAKRFGGKCYNCQRPGHRMQDCWSEGGGRAGQGPRDKNDDKEAEKDAGPKKETKSEEGPSDKNNKKDAETDGTFWSIEVKYHNDRTYAEAVKGVTPNIAVMEVNQSGILDRKTKDFIFDSGATHSLCCNRDDFFEYETISGVTIGVAEKGRSIAAIGKGTIRVRSMDNIVTLTDVYHVPGISRNVISQSKLDERGLKIRTKDGITDIRKNGKVIGRARKRNGLYFMEVEIVKPEVNSIERRPKNTMVLWHQRLAHLNCKDIKKLQSMSVGMNLNPKDEDELCEPCCLEKAQQLKFKSQDGKAENEYQTGDIIHADVCGPFATSIDGFKGYSIYKDKATGFMKINLLKQKNEESSNFKSFYQEMVTQTGKRIKKLVCDNGGEYSAKEFQDWARSVGMVIDYTAPHTPQQNGSVEREHRTIGEAVRAMLLNSQRPRSFWSYAALTAVYIRNRCPKSGKQMTPYEAWSGRKPDLSKIKIWGSTAYALVPDATRDKNESHGVKGILVGFETNRYILLDARTPRKVIKSRNVRFDEMMVRMPDKGSSGSDSRPTRSDSERRDDSTDGSTITNPTIALIPTELRRSERLNSKPSYSMAGLQQVVEVNATFEEREPKSIKQALSGPDRKHWEASIKLELKAHADNKTFERCDLPVGRKAIKGKMVFKIKQTSTGEIERFKSRFCACGYSQIEGIDYSKTSAPCISLPALRMVISLAAIHEWKIWHCDVKTAHLNGVLEEEIFMKIPNDLNQFFGCKSSEMIIVRLLKSLYGLKQAGHNWSELARKTMIQLGWTRCNYEESLFIKKSSDGRIAIGALQVDDFAVTGSWSEESARFAKAFGEHYEVVDNGELEYYMAIRFRRDDGLIFMDQSNYCLDIAESFELRETRKVETPQETGDRLPTLSDEDTLFECPYREAVGSLMYASVGTRPDISAALTDVSKHLIRHGVQHWKAVQRIIKYINSTSSLGLVYGSRKDVVLEATSGYIIKLGGGPISWKSKQQDHVTCSTTEAEYVALAVVTREICWLRNLLGELGFQQGGPTVVHEDNRGAIFLANHDSYKGKSRHIDVAFHYGQEKRKDRTIEVVYCETGEQVADMLTKGLNKESFKRLREMAGMDSTPAARERVGVLGY